MATISHEPARRDSSRLTSFVIEEMWASVAISVMWLAVLFDAVFGPDITSVSGGSSTTVPSAIVVAFFAFLGTWVIARRAFGHDRHS